MMLQGVPALVGNPGDATTATAEAHNSGGGSGGPISGGFNEEEKGRSEEGDRNSGGNRWPRQETMALLKIRSDMDVAFRDSGLKGPLWEDVSRKLAELGYHRSAKKCKEKFENVYKYHKRTKDGRTTKSDGKTYRFFEQLEALDTHPPQLLQLPPPPPQTKSQPPITAATTAMSIPVSTTNLPIVPQVTVPSTTNPNINPTNLSSPPPPAPPPPIITSAPIPYQIQTSVVSNSTSSSTSSDEEPERRRKRKRIWKEFFGRLMKEVIDKQEELQRKFLEALERRERDRMMREEAWRVQEMAKMNREHELLVQERSIAAAKDAAVIAFLQKMTEQQQHSQNPNPTLQLIQVQENPPPQPPPPQQQQQPPAPPMNADNVVDKFMSPSPSRWPKAEIQALIKLRTTLDMKYQENAPKGPLWEEISAAMRNLGYNRNAKRCKEKWENINKYYKKVKESNKKRPEDAKTCPYFHQLEAIYKEKAKSIDNGNGNGNGNSLNPIKSENPMVPIMVRPEQQWPHESEKNDHNDDEDTGEDDDEDDDEEDEAEGYEIVTNKASSMATVE